MSCTSSHRKFFRTSIASILLAGVMGLGQCQVPSGFPAYTDPDFRGLSRLDVIGTAAQVPSEARSKPTVPINLKPKHPGRDSTIKLRRVPIELAEDSGIARVGEPVRFGFPLPEGVLFDPAQIRLLSPSGEECPAQFAITGFWKDGSVKWMLVTFLADIQPRQRAIYEIEFGSDVRRSPLRKSIVFRKIGDTVMVNTGPMQVQLRSRPFRMLDKVWLDADGDGRMDDKPIATSASGGLVMTDRSGLQYTPGSADLRVEEDGPLALTLRFEGPYLSSRGKARFRHVTRLTFFASSTVIGVSHSHINDCLDYEFTDFRTLEMPFALGTSRAGEAAFLLSDSRGTMRWTTARLTTNTVARLFQRDDAAFTLNTGSSVVSGTRAAGVVQLRNAEHPIAMVAMEDFWQNYPGAIRATADGLSIELWPDIQGITEYASLPLQLRFPFIGGAYRFKWGQSKTHHLWLSFGGQDISGLAVSRLIPVVPPSWYQETGALGPVVARKAGEFEAWDDEFSECFERHMRRKETTREYGFFNWGDWYGERNTNWGNNEYDLPHGLFMQFARTGDRRYYRMALAGARHQADVDMVHAYPDPSVVGGEMLHSVCHTGEWSGTPQNTNWSTPYSWQALASNGHTWAEGLCDAWCLSGDARIMEAALGLGEHIVYGMVPRFNKLGTHERSAGWSLQAIMALYRVTLDPLYLDAARKIAEVAFSEQDKTTGVWPHPLPEGHCNHYGIEGAPICVGNAPFLIGILCSGLKEYYLASGDERARASLLATVPWWKSIWDPRAETFPYTTCTLMRTVTSPLHGQMCADALASLYELSGDPALLDMVARTFACNVRASQSGFGKEFGQVAQHAQRVMAILKKHEDKSPSAKAAVRLTSRDLVATSLAVGTPPDFLGVRSPERKQFFVLAEPGSSVGLRLERRPHGSRPKEDMTGTVTLSDRRDRVIQSFDFDTDRPFQKDVNLPGTSQETEYRLDISDDMRGIWDVSCGGAKLVLRAAELTSFGLINYGRFYFRVPAGVESFRLHVEAIHEGEFAAGVFDAENRLQAMATGEKMGYGKDSGGAADLVVRVPKGMEGRIWSVVLHASGDIAMRMSGVPPFLSRSPDEWFEPRGW